MQDYTALVMKIARIMLGGCETEIFLSLSHSSSTNLAMFMTKVMLHDLDHEK
jgi:hypothetical protein